MKKISGILCRLAGLALAAAVCLGAVLPARAAETGSFTFHYAVPDCGIRVYRVAQREGERFLPTAELADLAVNWQDLQNGGWARLAGDLQAAVPGAGIQPDWQGVTGADGTVRTGPLAYGLYLVLTDQKTLTEGEPAKKYTYTASPLLLALPGTDAEGGPQDQVDIHITKYVRTALPDKMDVTVTKIWRNVTRSYQRPAKIAVKLMRDGELYDVVELSRKNDWRHTWKDLEAEHEWRAVEIDQLDRFYVRYDSNASGDHKKLTLAVINTYIPPHKPNEPWKPLPQTGQDHGPVLLLAGAGALLLAAGLIRRRREEERP